MTTIEKLAEGYGFGATGELSEFDTFDGPFDPLECVADGHALAAWWRNMPFVLACGDCGYESDAESREQAEQERWTSIEDAPLAPGCNQVGVCPECREARP